MTKLPPLSAGLNSRERFLQRESMVWRSSVDKLFCSLLGGVICLISLCMYSRNLFRFAFFGVGGSQPDGFQRRGLMSLLCRKWKESDIFLMNFRIESSICCGFVVVVGINFSPFESTCTSVSESWWLDRFVIRRWRNCLRLKSAVFFLILRFEIVGLLFSEMVGISGSDVLCLLVGVVTTLALPTLF